VRDHRFEGEIFQVGIALKRLDIDGQYWFGLLDCGSLTFQLPDRIH